jgi:uncharacterized membrane protein YfcA
MRRRALSFLLGAVSGTLGGMMGVGGGTILVPLLVYVLHEEQHQAQGTSLAFVITALVAAASYYTFESLNLPVALYLILGAVPGVILGARLAAVTPGPRLRVAFGVLMALSAIRLMAAPTHGALGTGVAPPIHVLLGLVVGVLAGLLGIGGGAILVPVLVLGENFDQHTAQGTSLLMIVPVGVIGMVSYARQGKLSSRGLPTLLAGGAVGAFAGSLLAHRILAPTLTRLFAILLLAMAAQMIFVRPRGKVARSAATTGGSS